MPVLFVGTLALIALIMLLSLASAGIQRQVIGRRGSTSLAGVIRTNLSPPSTPAETPLNPAILSLDSIGGGSPAARGAQISAAVRRTDFATLGAPPLAQHVTTYLSGDDLYDESFSINAPDFLGEVGVSIADAVEEEGSKHVAAFTVWVFDTTSRTTVNKILLDGQAYGQQAIRDRLKGKGDVIGIRPGSWLYIQTSGLRVQVHVVDMLVRESTQPAGLFFDRLVLEVAIWRNDNQSIPLMESTAQAPVLDEDATRPSMSRSEMPEERAQRVETSYLITFARRVYVKQPFSVKVRIPARLARRSLPPRPRRENREQPGRLDFLHQWHPARHEQTDPAPLIRVELSGPEEAIQIPITMRNLYLRDTGQIVFDFPVVPLRGGRFYLDVKIYYMGIRWVAGERVGALGIEGMRLNVGRQPAAPKPSSGYTEYAELLAHETLPVTVKSVLGISPAWLNLLITVLGCLLIGTFLILAWFTGLMSTPQGVAVVGGGAVFSLLLLLLIPAIAGALNRLTVRRWMA